MEIKITNEVLPVISINYEEIKANLETEMKKYKGIIVTEETLSDCKQTRKDLAGIRNKIDSYRLEKKKEFAIPIVEFENKCKDLMTLVDEVEAPIKDGIKVFDDVKREEKRTTASKIIEKIIQDMELSEKYAQQLTVTDKYMNLSETVKATTEDIKARAMILKGEQNRENELLEIIQATIESENQRLKQKLSLSDFVRLITLGSSTTDILKEVKERADKIYNAENAPISAPKEDPILEEVTEVTFESVTEEKFVSVDVCIRGAEKDVQKFIDDGRSVGIVIAIMGSEYI